MTAAARARVVVTVGLLALSIARLGLGDAANGASRHWSAYLAPHNVCRSASDPQASPSAQAQAVTCLVNWARAQDRGTRLVPRSALERAALLKGMRVASCGQFSHTPCGTAVTAAVRASGYRFLVFGENLFAGPSGRVSARDIVRAWLESPPHRANLLRRGFRDVGAAPVLAPGLLGSSDTVVWTATFATRQHG